MNWYSVLLAAASGGCAAFVALLIFGKEDSKRNAVAITTVIFFILFNTLSKQFILPEINAYTFNQEVEKAFLDIPVYQAIKKNEPAIYEDIISSLDEGHNSDLTKQQLVDIIREKISKLAMSRMPHSSDKALLDYVSVMLEEMDVLHRRKDGSCYKFLYPQVAGGVSVNEIFSTELQQKDLNALNQIIISSKKKVQIPNEDEVMPLLEPIYLNIYSSYGDDASVVENPTQANVDQDMVCEIILVLYQDILALPNENSASILRWMFAQE